MLVTWIIYSLPHCKEYLGNVLDVAIGFLCHYSVGSHPSFQEVRRVEVTCSAKPSHPLFSFVTPASGIFHDGELNKLNTAEALETQIPGHIFGAAGKSAGQPAGSQSFGSCRNWDGEFVRNGMPTDVTKTVLRLT